MKLKVLIAEREANMQACLGYLMEREGYEVRFAGDGAEALAAIGDAVPDLALFAVDLHKHDGFELCRLVRAEARSAALPIIMVTAKARLIERDKALALGADDYVTKPFANEDLLARVRRVLAEAG